MKQNKRVVGADAPGVTQTTASGDNETACTDFSLAVQSVGVVTSLPSPDPLKGRRAHGRGFCLVSTRATTSNQLTQQPGGEHS
jgi:hypothetical protein